MFKIRIEELKVVKKMLGRIGLRSARLTMVNQNLVIRR